jgi:hypothetical protein
MSAAEPPPSGTTQQALEAETVLDTYTTVAEWIRFADAKAAVTLTVDGVLLGTLIPTLKAYLADTTTVHPWPWWTFLVIGLFVVWLVGVTVSAVFSFLCILPFRGAGRIMALSHATHFHPAAIAQKFPLGQVEQFVAECERIGMTGLKREVLTAMLIDSHLSGAKYRYVTRSIWCLAISTVFAVLFLLATLF